MSKPRNPLTITADWRPEVTITADTPLAMFAELEAMRGVPTIIHADAPRTRATDPVTSHVAGDASQRHMHDTKTHVLLVVSKGNPAGMTGSEINDLYVFTAARRDWARVGWDSPRKRAGELVEDGYLEVVGTRPAPGRGRSAIESVYALTEKGDRVVTLGLNP